MPNVKVKFFQATYALVKFVNISNCSAVSDPILTKLFGPNFLGVLIFLGQQIFYLSFFEPDFFWPKICCIQNFLDTIFLIKNFLVSKSFWTQILDSIFLDPKFFFYLHESGLRPPQVSLDFITNIHHLGFKILCLTKHPTYWHDIMLLINSNINAATKKNNFNGFWHSWNQPSFVSRIIFNFPNESYKSVPIWYVECGTRSS